ncbi:MAG: tetratricopeptide repeat protein [Deltaproteobacteria bacterium]|nr:tetratricopeptide repeat protein [Deltaproteobacteria bacterium]
MKLRCSRCRKSWIDTAEGTCASCGLQLGAEDVLPVAEGFETDVDLEEELNAELGRADAVPPPLAGDGAGETWQPPTITGVTGAGSLRHHGIPEKIPGVVLTPGMSLTPFEGYLLSLIDGATFVDDVIAASGLALHEAAIALQNLKEKGLIHFRREEERAPAPVPLEPVKVAKMSLRKVAREEFIAAEDPTAELEKARTARDAGDLARAREYARLAWMLSPDHPDTHALMEQLESPRFAKQRARTLHDLGARSHSGGDYPAAVNLYRGALSEFEPSAVIHHKLAMVLVLASGAYDDAEQHLLRAMQLQPNNHVYQANLQRLREMKAQVQFPR